MNKELTTIEPVHVTRTVTLDDFLQKHRTISGFITEDITRAYAKCEVKVKCADGYEVSVQCGHNLYCSPRETHEDTSVYTSFELGFPNRTDDMLEEYADNCEQTESVFAYVPRKVVEALVEAHGGILA